jgi:hypothetical protein
MVATTSPCDPLWAFVLGDYDDYYDDEATAKPKDESREPEQQGNEEQEGAPITSQASKSKAANNKVKQHSDLSSDDEEVMQYFLGPSDAQKHTKRSNKIFKKQQKKLSSTQLRQKEIDGKETLQAVGDEWRLFGDMPIPLKENVETFKARRKASRLEEPTLELPREIIVKKKKKEEPKESSLAFISWWKLKSRENSVTNDGSNTRNGESGMHSSGSTTEDGTLGDAGMDSLVGGAEDFDRKDSVINLTEIAVKRGRGIMDDDDIQHVEEEELQAKSSKDMNEKLGPVKQEKRGDLHGNGTVGSINADGPTLEGSGQRIYQSVDEYRLVSLSLPQKTSSTLEGSGQGIDQSGDKYRHTSVSLHKKPSSDPNRAVDKCVAANSIKDDTVLRARRSKPRQGFLGGLAARRNIQKFKKKVFLRSEMETASGRGRTSDSERALELADEPSDARYERWELRHSTASLGSNKMSESSAKNRPANSSNTRADRNERTAAQSESDGRPRSNRAEYLRKAEDPRYRNSQPDSYTRDTRSDPYARSRESNGYRDSQPAEFEYYSYDGTMIDDEYSYEDALENRRTLPAYVQREIDASVSRRSSARKVDQWRTDGPSRLRNPTTVDSKQRDRLSYAERLQYVRKSTRKTNGTDTTQRLSYPDLLEAGPSFGMISAGSLKLG